MLTFQDDSDGVGSESLSSGTQCFVFGCNTYQPKHFSTQQQHTQTTAVTHVSFQDLTTTAGWWQSDLSPLYCWRGNLNCNPPLCSICCFFFFFFPHQPSQISQFSTEPSGLKVTSVTQSYKAKSFSSCHGGKHFLVSHSCSAEKHVFAIWSNL